MTLLLPRVKVLSLCHASMKRTPTVTKEVAVVMSTLFNANPSPSSPAFDPKERYLNSE